MDFLDIKKGTMVSRETIQEDADPVEEFESFTLGKTNKLARYVPTETNEVGDVLKGEIPFIFMPRYL